MSHTRSSQQGRTMDHAQRIGASAHATCPTPQQPAGFTLVELLVVITIITVLISLLLPAAAKARQVTHLTICKSNLRQIHIASYAYAMDSRGFYPDRSTTGHGIYRVAPGLQSDPDDAGSLPETLGWAGILDQGDYLVGQSKVWVCPSQPHEWMSSLGNTYAFSVAGTLSDYRVDDFKMDRTMLLWDNVQYRPATSGVPVTKGSAIPTPDRLPAHVVGSVRNVNFSVVRMYGDGQIVFAPEQ